MKFHRCPTCGQHYGCPREAGDCGSPYQYDCHGCYCRRYRAELDRLATTLAERLGFQRGSAAHGDFCHSH